MPRAEWEAGLIEREVAQEAIETISVAIAAILEDAHELAVSRQGSVAEYGCEREVV